MTAGGRPLSEELLRVLEAKVEAVARECRRLRSDNDTLRAETERRKDGMVRFRRATGDTLRDLRSVLGSAVRILREE